MKTLLATLTLAITAATTSSAQIYRPSAVGPTAALGAVTGALIGGHNGNQWAQGAVIGAAAGALIGAVVDSSRPVTYATNQIAPVTVVSTAPMVGGGYATSAVPQPVVYVSQPAPVQQVVYSDSYYAPAATVLVAAGLSYAYYDAWHHNHGYYYGHGGSHGHGGYHGHGGNNGHHGGGHRGRR